MMFDSARPLSTDSAACVPWIESAVKNIAAKNRLLLWVDAVGGFYVCQGAEVRVGQAVPGSAIELPLLADLSRHHATIRRDEEGYTIEPIRDVRLNQQPITEVSWINDGSLIEMGPALKMRFRRPHPLSATARLDFVSNHRTQPSASAVLLLSDTCVMGPGAQNHIVCRHWPHDVVLYRQHGGLFCRSESPLEIDQVRYEHQGPLTLQSHVVGDQFSFSLEEI
ncbi:MAG: FHA domain-containing protein [Pirellulales bacterium]